MPATASADYAKPIYVSEDALIPTSERMYEPHGACAELFFSQAPEVVISGPAGSGKSICCLEKLHWYCCHVPKTRCLILRKTRESLTESALVTYENKVLSENSAICSSVQRRMRQAYHYPNGSEIIVGGMDNSAKVMSTEYDLIFCQEAIEITEDEWEHCTTRLRNGRLPFHQILADTNPDSPTHWLKRRCDSGQAKMIDSDHRDNPVLWDATKGDWTDFGRVYIARLDSLTGLRLQRLRYGKWVQAEGVVYDGWNPAIHVLDRNHVRPDWRTYWSIDFGYTNPFVWGEWRIDPDGRVFLCREIYRTQGLVEDHARRIKELTAGMLPPVAVICDHDAEDRATLTRHLGVSTVAAKKDVSPGIQAVASRLRPAGDGRPRLFILRDSLDQRDQRLVESKKPTCGIEELGGYIWNTAGGRKKGEEPVKEDDHFCDMMRYLIAHLDLRQSSPSPMMLGGGIQF